MTILKSIRNVMNKVLGIACILIFAAMVVIGTYQIAVRYIFNSPSTISEELLTYSFTWMALLAAALVFGKREHMRMGFLADKLSAANLKVLNIVLECITIVFALVVMVYGGVQITELSMTQKTASLGIPMGYIYLVVPISGVLIALYGVLNIVDIGRGEVKVVETLSEETDLDDVTEDYVPKEVVETEKNKDKNTDEQEVSK